MHRPRPPRRLAAQQQSDNGRRAGRDAVESTEDIRKGLLTEIRNYAGKYESSNLVAQFNDRLKKCIHDLKERHQTLLHWIVAQVESLDKKANDAEEFMNAAQTMVTIAMEFDMKVISQVDQAGNTALHHALISNDARVAPLITTMCDYQGAQEYLQEAIARKNNSGENCLHLAIDRNSSSVETLIKIANEAAFRQRRNAESRGSGQAPPNNGNTPLHDAVKYDRVVIRKPKCNKMIEGTQCKNCQEDTIGYDIKTTNAAMLVTRLIERCNKVLKVKNDNDESPYLYFLRTKAEYRAPGNEIRSLQNPHESTACLQEVSFEASISIERQLIESAFTVGGFKDACACFFGDKADEEGKSSPLRPGYPIIESSHIKYKQFITKDVGVLSHVDLQIARPTATLMDYQANTTIQEGQGSITQQQAKLSNEDRKDRSIRQWKKDMRSLTKIFAMLRDRGVERILKVTIKDNQKRPCSDQVIQECLAGFDVRYLNWNKPDLSASIICASCPKIAELTLYSSGRRAVLDSWLSDTGLRRLKQLTCVNLEAAAGLEEYKVYKTVIDGFQTQLIENIQFARRKLILASTLEMCQLDIEYIEGCIRDCVTSEEKADDLRYYQEALTEDQLKYQTCQEKLGLLVRERTNLEDRLLTYLSPGDHDRGTSAAAHASSEDRAKDSGKAEKSEGGNGTTSSSGIEHITAKDSKHTTVKDNTSYDQHPVDPRTMHRKWRHSDQYDGAPSQESKLFKTTQDVEDYNAGSLVSLEFQINIVLDTPPSHDRSVVRTITNSDGTISHVSTTFEQNRWLDAVRRFVEKWVPVADNKPEGAIKVALIDDGIDIRQIDNLVYHPGWPPAKPDSDENLWYFSEKGHGTIMAKMIFDMCPRAQLYVAKLGGYDDPKRIENAEQAADAIAWAIEKKVDIISMSWSLVSSDANKDGIVKLENKIKEAAAANILLYCAAADKGPFVEEDNLFPHNIPGVRIIGSAKETGGESHFVAPSQVHYLFPGENIPDLGNIGGSSIATALAAGLAALILWCFRFKGEKDEKIAHPNGMDKVFQDLTEPPSKWVNVTSLLGIESPRDIEDVVEHCRSAIRLNRKGRQQNYQ